MPSMSSTRRVQEICYHEFIWMETRVDLCPCNPLNEIPQFIMTIERPDGRGFFQNLRSPESAHFTWCLVALHDKTALGCKSLQILDLCSNVCKCLAKIGRAHV